MTDIVADQKLPNYIRKKVDIFLYYLHLMWILTFKLYIPISVLIMFESSITWGS